MKHLIIFIAFIFIVSGIQAQNNRLSEFAVSTQGIDWIKIKSEINISSDVFFKEYQSHLGFDQNYSFKLYKKYNDKLGFVHYRYNQHYKNVRIEGGEYILHELNSRVVKANGKLVNNISTSVNPVLTAEESIKEAKKYANASTYYWEDPKKEALIKKIKNHPEASFYPKPELVLVDENYGSEGANYTLCYKLEIYADREISREYLFVDAMNGGVIHTINGCQTDSGTAVTRYSGTQTICTSLDSAKYILADSTRGGGVFTYDLNTSTDIANAVNFYDDDNFWNNVNPEWDEAATDAHWGGEMTYDYYLTEHGRQSYDDNNSPIIAYVHYDVNWANASWNGIFSRYGDGNGYPYTYIKTVAHEFTHGVTDHTSNLVYQNESGALNESFSDIFGNAVANWAHGDTLTWGHGIPNPYRDMSNPKAHNDPDTYLGQYWYIGTNDNGGVHTNSGVQNYWFYLMAVGDTGTNDNGAYYDISGLGRDSAEDIAYRNTFAYLTTNSNYFDARQGSLEAAEDLYGACSYAVTQTNLAWHAVGVGPDSLIKDFQLLSVDFPENGCGLGANEIFGLEYKFNKDGCNGEIFAGDSLQIGYSINGATPVIETFIFTNNIAGGDSLNYTFNTSADLSATGNYSVDFFIHNVIDAYNTNDSINNKEINNALTITNEIITFEDRLGVVDSFFTVLGSNTDVLVKHRAASFGSNWGLQLGSFGASTANTTVPMDTSENFIVNPNFTSKACFCVDASAWTKARMVFDLKQIHSDWYVNNGFSNIVPDMVSPMRILINGNHIGGQYHPTTSFLDNFVTHILNIDAYAGTSFEACFEGVHFIRFEEDLTYITEGDHTFIDDVLFTDNVLVGIDEPSFIGFNVYPNPATGMVHIELSTALQNETQYSLTDVLGRTLITDYLNPVTDGYSIALDLSNYAKGIYLVSINTNNRNTTQRLIIK